MIDVSLLFKCLLNTDHQTFLWKIKIKHISKLFNVYETLYFEAVYYFICGREVWLLLDIGWFVLFLTI